MVSQSHSREIGAWGERYAVLQWQIARHPRCGDGANHSRLAGRGWRRHRVSQRGGRSDDCEFHRVTNLADQRRWVGFPLSDCHSCGQLCHLLNAGNFGLAIDTAVFVWFRVPSGECSSQRVGEGRCVYLHLGRDWSENHQGEGHGVAGGSTRADHQLIHRTANERGRNGRVHPAVGHRHWCNDLHLLVEAGHSRAAVDPALFCGIGVAPGKPPRKHYDEVGCLYLHLGSQRVFDHSGSDSRDGRG